MLDLQSQYLELVKRTPYLQAVARTGRTIIGIENYSYEVVIGAPNSLSLFTAPQSAVLVTQGDSDFILDGLSACLQPDPGSGMLFDRNVALQIQDLTTGKFFFSGPIAFSLVAGSAGAPFIFAAPRVISPNGSLQLTAQNQEQVGGSNYSQLFVSLLGTKILYQGIDTGLSPQ